ncbi:phage antirepressor KilAC domain-containing protein [Eubacterium sp. 1001713B170207_170306_E7]|uniref:phage antirepressor KilAC domain-containing protein n=1 Tax=Eubacterium sp. 1001713B170207_170306_E7 TaxID=2787097 RepID=UPI00189878BF|nr:phage antirepressor KilAC domain-containing protein [Eubacterium sp. 1001713B170207_170306_E7]
MNRKQTTPKTQTAPKAFNPWCGSCALKQEDRILGGFETLPDIDQRIELCFLEKQLETLWQKYEAAAFCYLKKTEPPRQPEEKPEGGNPECTVEQLAQMLRAQGLDIGLHRLYAWLRERGYIRYQNNRKYAQVPTRKALEEKLMVEEDHISITLCGQLQLSKMLLQEKGTAPQSGAPMSRGGKSLADLAR